jgi:hypothetical protein
VEVRFRLSDGSNWAKIAATLVGKQVLGYLPGAALTGLDRYEQERSTVFGRRLAGARPGGGRNQAGHRPHWRSGSRWRQPIVGLHQPSQALDLLVEIATKRVLAISTCW